MTDEKSAAIEVKARSWTITYRPIFKAAVSAPVDENQLISSSSISSEGDLKTGRLQIDTEDDKLVDIEAEFS